MQRPQASLRKRAGSLLATFCPFWQTASIVAGENAVRAVFGLRRFSKPQAMGVRFDRGVGLDYLGCFLNPQYAGYFLERKLLTPSFAAW